MELDPKQKAKELFQKHLNYFGKNTDEIEQYKAKQSALVTVDELISDFRSYRLKHYLNVSQQAQLSYYWEAVKEEIENI